ncbi:Fic family protein [Domibacillus aminovorans]|uniref:Uncharacterized protein n=1 Tax=Domibacillus aminovorans TaxID=29332 RepID=A0A177L1N4_9BACI|nr:hypothetical protein [Domibacillus aminovorans]OAH59528.1 hypothetical protein AWH49_18420 [Domibacillus aminovorans]
MILEELTKLKDDINALRPISPNLMKTIAQKFREEWAYHTNAIEGNTLTLREYLEVMNHSEAVYFLQDAIRYRDLSEGLIKEFHAILFEGVKAWAGSQFIQPGVYKKQDNHVLTPDGEVITCRLCMNFILMKAGYPPAIIRQEERSDYYSALGKADQGHDESFIKLVQQEIERSLVTTRDILFNSQKQNIRIFDTFYCYYYGIEQYLNIFCMKLQNKEKKKCTI